MFSWGTGRRRFHQVTESLPCKPSIKPLHIRTEESSNVLPLAQCGSLESGMPAQVSSFSLDPGSKILDPPSIALGQLCSAAASRDSFTQRITVRGKHFKLLTSFPILNITPSITDKKKVVVH
ncbi:hypothetical protein TNCV_1501321 [Trichonephila clavipes]|uniref:Uncharacterized protein n=1 Tax=Trichonephila clavipes TaxID=2585209 RepID=A0A8X6RTL1_TRICX|nr:hypothetical protein TNCV_1501321 [Trichonephila clavipes]